MNYWVRVMTGNRQFSRIIGITEGHIRLRLLSRGINPAAHYRTNLVELGYSQIEIAEWFAFFEAKIPAKFRKKDSGRPKKRHRSIPIKSPLNLDLTAEQNEQILAMSQLKRDRIYSIISTLKKAQEKGVLDAGASNKDIRRILQRSDAQISHPQHKRIVNKIRENGIQKFIDDFEKIGSGRRGKTKINKEDLDLFLQAYMSGAQHSVIESWEYMLGGRDPRDFASPQAFLYQTQKLYTAAQIDFCREGKEKALRTWGASVPRVSTALPCETWIGDGMLFDTEAVGANGKPARIQLTWFMDEKSKMPMGYVIHEGAQTTEIVLTALYRGMLKYRAPKNIIIDNGKPYRSKAFSGGRRPSVGRRSAGRFNFSEEERAEINYKMSAAGQSGINVQFTIPYNHKGKDVEREHERLHRGFDRWFTTYMGVNVERKPDGYREIQKKGEKKAKYFPTLEEFKTAFEEYLAQEHNVYVYKSGENAGKNPITLWNEGYGEYAAQKPACTQESLLLMCSRTTQARTIRGNGIYDAKTNTYYWHDKFAALIGEKAYLRVPPTFQGKVDDAGGSAPKVFCYDEKDRFICEAAAIERIAKLIDFGLESEKRKLAAAIKRTNTLNKEIAAQRKKSELDRAAAHARIAATRRKMAEIAGLDTAEKAVEANAVKISKYDLDAAEAKRQEQEGTKLPAVAVGQDFIPEKKRELKRF
jgi:hypothetical protein